MYLVVSVHHTWAVYSLSACQGDTSNHGRRRCEVVQSQEVSAKHRTPSALYVLLPFSPHLLLCELISERRCCLSLFSPWRACHSRVSTQTQEVGGNVAPSKGCDPPAGNAENTFIISCAHRFLSTSWKKPKKNRTFCYTPAVHLEDLSRCSACASQYLQHPPLICFTRLYPPPAPLLASPLIFTLNRPSAAQICVNTAACAGTSHQAYIINLAVTTASYLFMYLHRHISLKACVYNSDRKLQMWKHQNSRLFHWQSDGNWKMRPTQQMLLKVACHWLLIKI